MIDWPWKNWQYKNTAFLIISLVIFYYLADTNIVRNTINGIGSYGYLGSFIAGIFFVSIFTVAPASIVLYFLADSFNPIIIALTAGFGAVIGDYLILRLLKDTIFDEWAPVFQKIRGSLLKKLFISPFFTWLIPIMGATIIASPLPDEVGITMLGLSRVKNWQFLLITFLLNAIGIFLVVTLARVI
ncbi:MAG: hypothetical protein PHH45_00935 [Patescibacteria group bacterium]|jgi:hypothetical protein|nr:hypothetical protein [Patescibacteria group bacterium]HPL01497.1 hypothetical protein [bacterium]